jgi:hypothetical protein
MRKVKLLLGSQVPSRDNKLVCDLRVAEPAKVPRAKIYAAIRNDPFRLQLIERSAHDRDPSFSKSSKV